MACLLPWALTYHLRRIHAPRLLKSPIRVSANSLISGKENQKKLLGVPLRDGGLPQSELVSLVEVSVEMVEHCETVYFHIDYRLPSTIYKIDGMDLAGEVQGDSFDQNPRSISTCRAMLSYSPSSRHSKKTHLCNAAVDLFNKTIDERQERLSDFRCIALLAL